MPPSPAVSVVLPVWNGERFLAEAVESILSQTLGEVELLLVDDGSTDATAQIAHGYARRDPRVVVVSLPKSGIARALNAGIARACGRYVARMDADDVAHPTRLARQVAFLDADAACVAVGTGVAVVDEDGRHIGTRVFPEDHDAIVDGFLQRLRSPFAHPTVATRRAAVVSVGGYRPERFPSEDFDLWMRLSRVGRLANIPEPLLRYRRHRGTIGVRERCGQDTMTVTIANEARLERGLPPLDTPRPSRVRSALANYHTDCARTAVTTGPRGAAIRHASAGIVSEPTWIEPWLALAACTVPKPVLRFLVAQRR